MRSPGSPNPSIARRGDLTEASRFPNHFFGDSWLAFGGPAMLTKMTEEDWVLVLEVFHACRSRRGDKGRDDRKFFEALHYFTVHNMEALLALEPQRRVRNFLRS